MIYERIKELCKKHGLSINLLEKRLGISKGYLSKIDSVKPSNERLKLIASFFGVTVDFLLSENREEIDNSLFLPEETRKIAQEISENKDLYMLLEVSRKASPEHLRAYYNLIKSMQDSENTSK